MLRYSFLRIIDIRGNLEFFLIVFLCVYLRLQLCVSEWEEFEAEREELALWLADMDALLTEIDHMTGSNCEKLRKLQVSS